jgi:hypothetical protein
MSELRSSPNTAAINAQLALAQHAVRTFWSKAYLDTTAEHILMGLRRKGKHKGQLNGRKRKEERRKQEGKKETVLMQCTWIE